MNEFNEIQPSLAEDEQLPPELNEALDASADQDTYVDILGRLEAQASGPQSFQQEFEPKVQPQAQALDENSVKQIVAQDLLKIDNLMRLGLANPIQAQNLKQQVLKNAFDTVVQQKRLEQSLPPSAGPSPDRSQVFSEFEKENSEFFSQRKEILEYLNSDRIVVDKDELKKISKMVEIVEKNAIDRYLKKASYEKNLQSQNQLAKQKLTANAQSSQFSDKNFGRIFTREQIGKLSGAEFAKYESVIMAQLKKGLIK